MGYFRDDQPLYELMLDGKQQKNWTRCGSKWISSLRPPRECTTNITPAAGKARRPAGRHHKPRPDSKGMNEDVTTEAKIKKLEAKFLAKPHRRRNRHQSHQELFRTINDTVRSVEKTQIDAEPGQLQSLWISPPVPIVAPCRRKEELTCGRTTQCRKKDRLTRKPQCARLVAVLMSPDFLRIDGSRRQVNRRISSWRAG